MNAQAVLGPIALDDVPVFPHQPGYRGISERRKKPSERRIDEAYLSGDLDETIEAVVDHCAHLYLGDAPYSTTGTLNLPLADRVGVVILRSLPGYDGPEEPLAQFDGRVPLSSFVNLKSKQAHLDLVRQHRGIKSHEMLACELIKPGAENCDVLAWLADTVSEGEAPELTNKAKSTANPCWYGQRYSIQSPEILVIVGQAVSRLTDADRDVIRRGDKGKDFRRVERRLRRQAIGWHDRSRKYPLTEICNVVDSHGGVLACYESFTRPAPTRVPRAPKTIENSGFEYYYPGLEQ